MYYGDYDYDDGQWGSARLSPAQLSEKVIVSHAADLLTLLSCLYLSLQTYLKAVNSGQENIRDLLYADDAQKQLVPSGPRIVHQSSNLHRIVDTEDTDLRCLAQADGKLVTEKTKTYEHDEVHEEDLPDGAEVDPLLLAGKVEHKVGGAMTVSRRPLQWRLLQLFPSLRLTLDRSLPRGSTSSAMSRQ